MTTFAPTEFRPSETARCARLATYRALGARESNGTTMLEWDGGHATR